MGFTNTFVHNGNMCLQLQTIETRSQLIKPRDEKNPCTNKLRFIAMLFLCKLSTSIKLPWFVN